jgi:hypothetical protein
MDTELQKHYALLLGVGSPWEVKTAELKLQEKKVEIELGWQWGQSAKCPECGRGLFDPRLRAGAHVAAFRECVVQIITAEVFAKSGDLRNNVVLYLDDGDVEGATSPIEDGDFRPASNFVEVPAECGGGFGYEGYYFDLGKANRAAQGLAFGHGAADGNGEDGGISHWRQRCS